MQNVRLIVLYKFCPKLFRPDKYFATYVRDARAETHVALQVKRPLQLSDYDQDLEVLPDFIRSPKGQIPREPCQRLLELLHETHIAASKHTFAILRCGRTAFHPAKQQVFSAALVDVGDF